MYKTFIALFFFTFMISTSIKAQDLLKYKWSKRLIVVQTEEEALFKKQIAEFENCKEGSIERKLKIIRQTAKKDIGFQVQLIGLDGGVKYQSKEVVKCEQLFTMIDGMPMRQRELLAH